MQPAALPEQNDETVVGAVTLMVLDGFAGSCAFRGCVLTFLGLASQATSKRMGPNGVMYRSPTPGATSRPPAAKGWRGSSPTWLASTKVTMPRWLRRASAWMRSSAEKSTAALPPMGTLCVANGTQPATVSTSQIGVTPSFGPCRNGE